jgi:MFS family permease
MCWLLYSIYIKVKSQPFQHEQSTISYIKQHTTWFIMALILMPVNWCLEVLKWQRLVTPLHATNFLGALRGVLSGMAISIFLPNRMGEFGGRIIQLPQGKRLQGIALSLTGSISQLLATVLFGSIALFICNIKQILFGFYSYTNNILPTVLNYVGLGTSIVLVMIYVRIPWLFTVLEKIPLIKKFLFALKQAEKLTNKDLLFIFSLSTIRYIVFVVQYVFMLKVFNVPISFQILLLLVAVYYLILSVIPSITFAELGIRGKVALLLFGSIAVNYNLQITLATSIVFVVNLLIPAAIGSVTMVRLRKLVKE